MKDAPGAGWATTWAVTPGAVPRPPFHAEIEPFRLAKMNVEALPSLGMMKPVVLLKTCPVGPVPLVGGGMLTTRAWGTPRPL